MDTSANLVFLSETHEPRLISASSQNTSVRAGESALQTRIYLQNGEIFVYSGMFSPSFNICVFSSL